MSVVGIDLGTTNTVVACVRSGKVHVLADEHGLRLLPSVVSFHPNGEVLVGGAAKARRIIDPKNTVYSHKRLIGRSWGSPEIAQAKSRFAFELKEGPGQGPLVRARGQDYTLPEISAFVLKRARQISETALGGPVERAVITVPAHFNELQRASTKVAGRVSGLEVLRILNEPTAAALAYGLGRTGNERVAVYDFGGGTFDCTLLDLNGNVFEVLATAGDSFLGGDDVDNLIAERMADTYLKAHRYDPRTDAQMLERLKTSAEDIKMVLSTAETHTIVLKEFGHGQGGSSVNFTFTLTRRDLDAMITPLVERSFKVTQDALSLARLSPTSFDKIILVGGSTRIPLIRKRVEAFFGQAPLDRVNPDEVVSIGAAIQAAALTEGARRRSIPAAPPVIGKPKTLQGLQKDLNDDTQTGTFDADKPQAPAPGPAFGSSPPGFGFHPASSPPPGTPGSSPPPPSSPGVAGARQPAQPGRKITNPGVAPATQPLGARSPSAPPAAQVQGRGPTQANEDDPSMASFPDLAVPTPFEWFPSGHPSSGAPPAGSERSFGGNTIDARGTDPNTMTAAIAQGQAGVPPNQAFMTGPPRPARMGPDDSAGFGAIDEPPSMYSTPSASVPSFPSMTGPAGSDAMPSPIGEPEPFRGGPSASDESIPGGQFGAVRDLSLVSTSAVTSGIPNTVGNPSEPAFGHLPDLSLVSTSSATAEIEDVTEARLRMSEALEDDTEANTAKKSALAQTQVPATVASATADTRGSTMNLEPAANPARGAELDDADLPAVVPTADLPAVVNRGGKRPEIRKGPKEPGMSASGAPSMIGKPPPMLAPQPFGPMERIGEESPTSRTASLQGQGRPQIQPKPGGPAPKTQPQAQAQAKQPTGPGQPKPKTQPLATTASLGLPPSPPPTANASGGFPAANVSGAHPAQPGAPAQGAQGRSNKTAAFGSTQAAPPPAQQSAPQNPAFNSTPALSAHGVPAPQPSTFGFGGSAPPPAQQYQGSQPPSPFAQAPQPPPMQAPPPMQNLQHTAAMQAQQPPPMQPASQPPLFGAYPSAPPDAHDPGIAHGSAFEGNTASMPPQAQAPIQSIGYASPVLVDVTPRGLVVETAGGYTDTIIPRNSKIPCERTRRFATGRDMQTTVRVRVAQGEHQFFPQNTYLGEVELSGLRPAPRGEVVVAVTFEVDADGTLRVRARDVQTGQEARAVLQLIGVADESSVVMMINRFAQQPVVGGPSS